MYTIFCLLKSETVPFSVEINEMKSVDGLKKSIREEMSAVDVEARKLELYHVNIKFDESHEERHIAQANEVLQGSTRQSLRPWLMLSKIAEGFPEGELHILIQLPPGESIHSRACGTVAEMYPPNPQFHSMSSLADHPLPPSLTPLSSNIDVDAVRMLRGPPTTLSRLLRITRIVNADKSHSAGDP